MSIKLRSKMERGHPKPYSGKVIFPSHLTCSSVSIACGVCARILPIAARLVAPSSHKRRAAKLGDLPIPDKQLNPTEWFAESSSFSSGSISAHVFAPCASGIPKSATGSACAFIPCCAAVFMTREVAPSGSSLSWGNKINRVTCWLHNSMRRSFIAQGSMNDPPSCASRSPG